MRVFLYYQAGIKKEYKPWEGCMSITLIKAQCTNCGATLDVNQNMDAAICPFCNTPYVVEKAVNLYKTENHNKYIMDGANVHISSGVLDPDTMFENWLVTGNHKLEEDFKYYYATDIRRQYLELINKAYIASGCLGRFDECREYLVQVKKLINDIFVGERFGKYKELETEKRINALQERMRNAERYAREKENEERRRIREANERKEREAQLMAEEARSSRLRKTSIAIIIVTVILLFAMISSCAA